MRKDCRSRPRNAALVCAGFAIGLSSLLSGCGGAKNRSATEAAAQKPVVALPPKPEEPAATSGEQWATQLEEMYDAIAAWQEGDRTETGETPALPARSAAQRPGPSASSIRPATPEPAAAEAAVASEQPVGPPLPEPAPVPLEQRRAELAAELARLLKPEASGADLARAAVPLIALETLQPGAAHAELEALAATLPPSEAQTLSALRELLRQLASTPGAASDPAALARLLDAHAARLDPSGGGLSLGGLALCRRVESFGRYTPVPGTAFVAGRAHPLIVYVEVENFAQVAADTGAGWQIELDQRIGLYHDADGSLQWHQPEAPVRDVSRAKRRDYYMVRRIELPANLSVGKYNLKVTVRDRATGAEAESVLPIQIVADPRLAGHGAIK